MYAIEFQSVFRHFGSVKAVDGVDLAIEHGEFFAMLGPSGSGKTTCLRMIAGFDHPTSGRIQLYGRDVTSLAPYERDVNTVFQDYALFPHMTVADNIGYGLMIRKVDAAERRRRVDEMLELVRLPGFGARKPAQLSGGQRQRVALARALINKPKVLLLDEPLGALDLKLRQEMQVELKTIQQQVGITFVFVTHDQEEALTMSDNLAVFNHGRIEQVGSPAEIYEKPATAFVAGFVGISNLIDGAAAMALTGVEGTFTVRPEKIHLGVADAAVSADATASGDDCVADGVVCDVVYLGLNTRYRVELDLGPQLTVIEQNLRTTSMDVLAAKGRRVRLSWGRVHNHRLKAEAS